MSAGIINSRISSSKNHRIIEYYRSQILALWMQYLLVSMPFHALCLKHRHSMWLASAQQNTAMVMICRYKVYMSTFH